MTVKIRRFSELMQIGTLEDRFDYLVLSGSVGRKTFGFDRYLNQRFYHSVEWHRIRDLVITRDYGCELGLKGYDITSKIIVHHMNPINSDDIRLKHLDILNPEYLVCCSLLTHEALHYGDKSLLPKPLKPRYPRDTRLW